jgi:tRNA(Leu) C34 or U34 (ribose-2'-O)-methylase TrmL
MCLVLSSVNYRANVGMCIRSAVAMGCTSLVVTGASKVRTEGAQRTEKYVELRSFPKLAPAVSWLREQGFTICGIEISPRAVPVHLHPFRGPTAFLAGNEGSGLPPEHQELCDHLVYIPQYSHGTASLNVAVATSIVLSHFAQWAGYAEARRDPAAPEKYLVELPAAKRGVTSALDAEIHAARAAARGDADGDEGGGGDGPFGTLFTCEEEEGEEGAEDAPES